MLADYFFAYKQRFFNLKKSEFIGIIAINF